MPQSSCGDSTMDGDLLLRQSKKWFCFHGLHTKLWKKCFRNLSGPERNTKNIRPPSFLFHLPTMTLLASERSLLIRSKFRSVLQLRIQNRRQQKELNADSVGVTASSPDKVGDKEANGLTHQTEDGATLKSPPSGLAAETAQDRTSRVAQRQKKARLTEDAPEKVQKVPGSLELLHNHIVPLDNTPVSFALPSDVFEDDVSSCASASPEQLGIHQSPGFSSSSPGLSSDQSLSDVSPVSTPVNHSPGSIQQQCSLALFPADGLGSVALTVNGANSTAMTGRPKGVFISSQTTPLLPKTAQPLTQPSHLALGGSLSSSRPPRPRKTRECKPKMRKLKYHQYIPPDQRVGSGGGANSSAQKSSSVQVPPIDPAHNHQLQQQQIFLQLQILNQQQQLTLATSSENQIVGFSGSVPGCPQPIAPATNPTLQETSPTHKPELLPPNLDDLTVSELRQQLRKRGLPVSGTKPALLERLRPFQMPRHQLSPTPLCPMSCPLLSPTPLCQMEGTLDPSHPPSLGISCADASSSPSHLFVQPTVLGEPGVTGVTYLTSPASSAGSSPNLPAPSPPLSSGTLWRSEQAAEELSVELEMRERIRSRPRGEKALEKIKQQCGGSLHPFLQQDPGSKGKADTERQEILLTQQVFSCQPCDSIGQDFELPVQITASPEQASSPAGRSLEELLQEAIQKVQMDPSESIDDILEDPVSCSDNAPNNLDVQTSDMIVVLTSSSPQPPTERSSKDEDRILSASPLCSSLLLELPQSPVSVCNSALPRPLPPPMCSTPPFRAASRKRRSVAPAFDAADWLESLSCGLQPLTPPAAPFLESDFGLDSDLSVNRVLDLIVEQW
ncbi:myocardin [Hoplias malabaricus]|uniref:myocardin n=1 Tax=Hoplias malabaricus TaxID=27720 RepID=UPI0034618102